MMAGELEADEHPLTGHVGEERHQVLVRLVEPRAGDLSPECLGPPAVGAAGAARRGSEGGLG
jgi:hypothetical protein